MEDKKFNFNVTADPEGKPLVIQFEERTGDAKRINEKQKFRKSVFVSSILEYVRKRNVPTPVQDNPGVIIYSTDPKGPFVEYYENPNDAEATVLDARLKENPDLTAFGINTGRRFTQKALELHVRTYAHVFGTVEEVKEIIAKMQNFDVRFEQQAKKGDDRQGNAESLIKQAIKFAAGELPKTITITLPLYEGTSPVPVTLEIEIDKGRENLPEFSFYSIDLELRKRSLILQAIGNAVTELSAQFPVLEQ